MKIDETATVLCGFCFVCFKAYVTSSGYKHFLERSVTLLSIILAFVIQHNVQTYQDIFHRTWDPGLWVCLLLPSVANGVEIEDRCLLRILVLVTFVSYINKAGIKLTRSWLGLVFTVYLCLSADLVYHKPRDALTITAFSMVYMYLLHNIPEWFKKSFTFGEAAIVLQLYVCQTFRNVKTITMGSSASPLDKLEVVVFIGLHIAVLSILVLSKKGCTPLLLWPALMLIGLTYLLLACLLYFDTRDINRILHSVILTNTSAVVLSWWSLWLISSILLVCFHGNKHPENIYQKPAKSCAENFSEDIPPDENVYTEPLQEEIVPDEMYRQIHPPETDVKQASCDKYKYRNKNKLKTKKVPDNGDAVSVRKYFHVAMICVYIPGLILCPNLLYLASVLVAVILIILEVIRMLNVEPLGPVLNGYLWVFLDEQDTGDLILTPIYLLIGCSLPLWWNYKLQKAPCSLSMYSGLISVGIGDGAASFIGRKYGRHKWPGSKKSVEGTSAAIISQIIAIYFLSFIKIPGAVFSMETVLCIIFISLLEAFTNQIDNLVVPVFAWVLMATIEPTY